MLKSIRRQMKLAALAATVATAAPAFARGKAPAAANLPKPITSVEGITEYGLPNGLRVLLFPDQSKPTVTVNVTYFVGSRHEGYGETGMAHLLEHMMFKGTKKRGFILEELEKHGAMPNGTTSYDRTNYFEVLPAVPGNLDYALDLESDRMVNSRIDKADLDKEFSVVRNEFEMGENNPDGILEERMLSTAYLWHNYGKSTIGSRSDIERVPIDNLKAFYQRFYQPDNAMLVVAGKFDPNEALALVVKHFGPLPRPTRKLSPTYTVEPVQDGERTVTLRRVGDTPVVGLVYHGVAGADPDSVAEEALAHLLTDRPSGRLYKALVEAGLATEVSGDAQPLAEAGFLEFFAKLRADQSPDKALAKLIEVVEASAKQPVTADEVKRYQTRALKLWELSMTDSARIGIGLSEWAAIGDWRMMFLYRDRVKKLTPQMVQSVAQRFLKQSNRTVGEFLPTKAPERAPQPPLPDVAAMVKDYKGEQAVASGEAFDATIDNIDKRTVRSTLPSGMKVALLEKSSRGGAVHAIVQLHFGTEADLKNRVVASQLLSSLLMHGTKKHNFQQLRDELDRLKAEVRIGDRGMGGGQPGELNVSITTVKENLVPVIGLVAEILEQPALDKTEFEQVRKEMLEGLEAAQTQPDALAFNNFQRKIVPLAPDHVRYKPTLPEEITRVKAVKLDDLVALHKLYGASDAQVAIVGEFDQPAVSKALTDAFGSWKSAKRYQRVPLPYPTANTPADEVVKTPDKDNAMIVAGLAIKMKDDAADYAALDLANHILGGGATSRLWARLRQKEGWSYGAFSFVSVSHFDDVSVLGAGAICAPQNATKAMVALVEEINHLLKDGVPASELGEAKKSYQLGFDNRLANDGFVAHLLAESLYFERALDYYKKHNAEVQAVSANDVIGALKKYLDPAKLVRVRAGDLKD